MSQHWLQVVNDHYSGWGDQQLVDDLSTFFFTNGTTKRLWKQLADQIGNALGFEGVGAHVLAWLPG